ncbi:DUF4249 domain-containing protein [Porifericola rhodea]|uniref:DUF4249 domain-containing protein n=1 Tax=Porifericola rhodea TaxID=930972 RepID=UPI002666D688|nr:DUF4249 domain-containing protein [Porifericola rhodea]WKN32196.1 DUF4249 domain-containing protein [Porifericola rhodea]
MKTIIKLIILTFSAAMLFSCEETIELDLEQTPAQYVVDALITNEDKAHYVKLTSSKGFYEDGATPRVSGAEVIVKDDQGNRYQFLESEEEPGLYVAKFEGKVGYTYSLDIQLSSREAISAEELMHPIQAIDSLVWDYDEEAFEEDEDYPYVVKIYALEPSATKDYYLFKFYRNDSIQNFDSNTGLFYADDELIGSYIYGLEGPESFKDGDKATFEMYRISRDAYLFYNDLDNTLNGDGGMFGPSPTNPRTNIKISNGVGLGLFQVSAVDRTTIIVGE